jgi:hypothetical protein
MKKEFTRQSEGEHTMAEIPKFKNEDEEIEFWDTHSLGDYIDDTEEVDIRIIDKRQEKKRTTIYLSAQEHEMIRRLAFGKNISMAEFIRLAVREKMKKVVGG